ncbi:MAG: hypothetical protein EAX90_01330 [Candidatus Heimdallarchaeota archaeon]|nr:hypothetical protein [Candidatus Heimdallarchaeota archaeon]
MLKRISIQFSVLFLILTILCNVFANTSFTESLEAYGRSQNSNLLINQNEDIVNFNLKKIGNFNLATAVVDVFILNNIAFLADEEKGFLAVNITDLNVPTLLSRYQLENESIYDIEIRDNYGFLAHGRSGLVIVDLSDPENIIELSRFDDGGIAWSIYLYGNFLFLADRIQGIEILDITNLANPVEISQYDGKPFSVVVKDDYAFVAAGISAGLEIINIKDITNPKKVAEVKTEFEDTVDVYIKDDYVYVANLDNGLKVYKITNPKRPKLVSQYLDGDIGSTWSVVIEDEFAYVADEADGIEILDMKNPTLPKEIAQYHSNNNGNSYALFIQDDLIFIADYTNGMEIVTWKTTKPIPTDSNYVVISNATLNFNHSIGPYGLNAVVGNDSVGLNISLLMDIGLKSPINVSVEAPEKIFPGEDTNLKIRISSEASSFWTKLLGTITLESLLGSTEIISLAAAGIPEYTEIAAFETFIGRNLSEDTNLKPIVLWEDKILNITLKLIMTPNFNVTGTAIVSAMINNENKTINMEWESDREQVIVPIKIPETDEDFYTIKLEDFKFIIDDLKLDFYSLRFDIVALDLVPIYTWILNFDDLFNSTEPIAFTKGAQINSIFANQENNRTLLYLDGEYLLGDYLIVINFTRSINLPSWAIALILLGILLMMAIPWILIYSTTRSKREPQPELDEPSLDVE